VILLKQREWYYLNKFYMKIIILFLLVFTIETSVQSQSGWVVQPSGVNFVLNKITFINSQTGFVIGYSKNILKTTDRGENWNQIFTVDSVTELRDIFFVNQNTGYAAGGVFIYGPGTEYYFSSTLAKTTNSGNNWFTVFRDTNQSPPTILGSVYFTSSDVGYIGAGLYSNGDGRLFKTTDGAVSWNELSFDNINGYPFSMYFSNELTGNAAVSNKAIKTTNGGINWTQHNSSFAPSFLLSLFFIDQNTGYACGGSPPFPGQSFIMKTTNAGDNWNTLLNRYGNNDYDLNSIYFPSSNIGYAVGSSLLGIGFIDTLSIILKTTDSGIKWGFQNSPHIALRSVYFFDPDTGFAVGMNGTILKTTDGGGEIISNINYSGNIIAGNFSLSQNYPNPFNPKTIIRYSIPSKANGQLSIVKLLVFDNLGKEIVTLVNEKQNAGSYSVEFNGENLSSGIYFYKLSAVEFTETKRMILLK